LKRAGLWIEMVEIIKCDRWKVALVNVDDARATTNILPKEELLGGRGRVSKML